MSISIAALKTDRARRRRARRDRSHDVHPDNRPGQTWVEARSFALFN